MSRREVIARGLALIVDTLFPLVCLSCNEEGDWLCKRCRRALTAPGVFCCPLCHRARVEGWRCGSCARDTYVDQHIALDEYNEKALLGRLIEVCKYQYLSGAISGLRPLIQDFFSRYGWLMPTGTTVVVPVPLHPRRQAERGFNQARLIAEIVAEALCLPLLDALTRPRYTRQQARLKRTERIKNVQGAFQLVKKMNVASPPGVVQIKSLVRQESLAGSHIVLVDDVYTTGSTMQECARTLKEAGVLAVTGFTLARG